MGKEKCQWRCNSGRSAFDEVLGWVRVAANVSTFTVSRDSPCVAQRAHLFSKLCKSCLQSSERVVQKLSSTSLPRKAESVRGLPERSGREKSGAGTGASSQVSTWVGSDSVLCRALEIRETDFAGDWKGSKRDGPIPSSTQIR